MTIITVKSDSPIVVLPLSEYESLLETLEILTNSPDIIEKIEKARRELLHGEAITTDEFFK